MRRVITNRHTHRLVLPSKSRKKSPQLFPGESSRESERHITATKQRMKERRGGENNIVRSQSGDDHHYLLGGMLATVMGSGVTSTTSRTTPLPPRRNGSTTTTTMTTTTTIAPGVIHWRRGQILLAMLFGTYFGVTLPLWWYGFQDAEQRIRSSTRPFHTESMKHWIDLPTIQHNQQQQQLQQQQQVVQTSHTSVPPSSSSEGRKESTLSSINQRLTQQEQQQQQHDAAERSRVPTSPSSSSSLTSSSSSIPLLLQQQSQVQAILKRTMGRSFLPLQAITEENNHLGNRSDDSRYSVPIPIRIHPKLQTFTYFQNVQSCYDLPNGWPVDHPQDMDEIFGTMDNILGSLYEKKQDYAQQYCPVDLDPFLPWIHDVIPSTDGKVISIIAHNKRRCRQDPSLFQADQDNLEPQVALMQSIPVQRLSSEIMEDITGIPDDWKKTTTENRYRLTSIEEADEDGKETRFICQFHMLQLSDQGDSVERTVVGETLSVYPYNYEHANLMNKRGQKANPMLTRAKDAKDFAGIHNEQVSNAILHFDCPVPSHLQDLVSGRGSGGGNDDDDDYIPTLYVDIVPIRTPPRDDLYGYNPWHIDSSTFDPMKEWGRNHVLPPVSQSGRWQNVPICRPAMIATPPSDLTTTTTKGQPPTDTSSTKENYMVGCLWAAAVFSTRGENKLDTSTMDRLIEWLAYHLDVAGFDKIIIYDNTEAFTNQTSLKPVVDLFGEDRVVWIPWKHRVCNNNRPTHPNAGERSSQYAAEASCRIRYGPTTEWMMSFDTDEYLVPQGNYTSMKDWLVDSVAERKIGADTHILSFYQIRSMLNFRFTEGYQDDDECRLIKDEVHCLKKQSNMSFMESFCEPVQFPKPDWTTRAKKQLYRPSFVLNHFIHYAAVTRLINEKPKMPRVLGRPYERRVNELSEAFMLHTKTTPPKMTRDWKQECVIPGNSKCRVGIPWPYWQEENKTITDTHNKEGFAYNCFENRKIHTKMVGEVRRALRPYLDKWKPKTDRLAGSSPKETPEIVLADQDKPMAASSVQEIKDFEPDMVSAVIATKIQGNSTIVQLEQALCLLTHAYNNRPRYDIIVFAATPITEAETARLKQAALPANLEVHMDNPGLDKMIRALRPDQLEHLLERCNVTEASELTWKTKCAETLSWGRTTNTPIQYAWQAEFRSLHLWNHHAISRYKYMMWFDSDAFCTKVSVTRLYN